MDKKKRKMMEFWKGRQNENKEKQNRKKRRIFKTSLLGEQRGKPSKTARNSLLGAFPKKKEPKPKRETTQTPKNKQKQPPFCMLANSPQCLVNSWFSTYTLLFLQLCVLLKTLQKIVFSAERSFCVSQIVKPLSRPLPRMTILQQEVPFGVFHCACWNP